MSVAVKSRSSLPRPEAPAVPSAPPRTEPPSLARGLSGIVHVLTCGSVDDGKSTLIGRLLWDASDLPTDTRATVLRSAGPDGVPDLSLLVDGLAAEREQGITIDVAWRYFDAEDRRYVIIDSPGHEQYTRNMATGASHADVAVLLIDARHGVKRQTRRHAAILDLVGLKRVVLAVNKMDLVDWSEARFREIEAEFRAITRRFAFEEAAAIPVAARLGDNVAQPSANMPWYAGATLLEALSRVPSRGRLVGGAFRMPVQTVLRGDGDFRGLAGTVSSGEIAAGALVRESLSGRVAKVRRIVTMDGDLAAAAAGAAVVLELDADLDIARGALLTAADDAAPSARALDAKLVWLADRPLDTDHGVLLRTATDIVPVSAITIRSRLDLETLAELDGTVCGANDIVVAGIELARPVALDRFADARETGSFVLVDALSGATLAGGIVAAATAAADAPHSATDADAFRLTREVLARGLCAGLDPASAEFRRRAEEAAILIRAAGRPVTLAID